MPPVGRGYLPRMEDTPICASVEKDLDITVDELVTGTAVTATPPPPAPSTAPSGTEGGR